MLKGLKYHQREHLNEVELCVFVAQSCPVLCDPMDWNPSGSSVHGISQVRIMEWVAIFSSRGSSQSSNQTHVSCMSPALAGWLLYHGATWEALARDTLIFYFTSPSQAPVDHLCLLVPF